MRRVLEAIFKDWGELLTNNANQFVHILDLGVNEHEHKVYEEEGAEEGEQMNTKLVSHGQLVPMNLLPNITLASSECIHVLFVFEGLRFLHFA